MRLLLKDSNTKLRKQPGGKSWLIYGLSLSPHKLSGKNVCPYASPGCISACINTSGFGIYNSVQAARLKRTELFWQDRKTFLRQLYKEVGLAAKLGKKKNKRVAIRLNVFSDISWEKICPKLFSDFSDVTFYDYTKNPNRAGWILPNYYLTFSRSETNDQDAIRLLSSGKNVAVVFDKLPRKWNGFSVISGDRHDLRFLDKPGRVIGLLSKGKGKKDETGFVQISNLRKVSV